jgi:hypothetical protein
MAEDWDIYICPIDDHLTSVFVDLALHDEAPQAHRPWLLRVAVSLRDPGPDGLGVPDEVDALYAIEDDLFQQVAESFPSRYVGRTTSQGRRARSAERLVERVDRLRLRFPAYTFNVATILDTGWDYYFDTLFPSDLDWQTIQTRRQIDAMIEHGIDVNLPCDVVHVVRFPEPGRRIDFRNQSEPEGFQCEDFSPDEAEEHVNRFGLRLVRRDPIALEYLDGLVVDLFLRAAAGGGEYDGWTTATV